MSIFDPKPQLSPTDRRLLALLATLLLEQLDTEARSTDDNIKPDQVALSERQAAELLTLLERLVSSKEFIEKISFVEGMVEGRAADEGRLREIYLAGRRKTGRTRVASSWLWADFQVRLGIMRWPVWRPARSERMSFEYFLEMEKRLCLSLIKNPRLISLILDLIKALRTDVERVRNSDERPSLNIMKNVVRPVIEALREQPHRDAVHSMIGKRNVAALWTVVSDVGVLCTTRDWGVAGTISTIAGALAVIKNPEGR